MHTICKNMHQICIKYASNMHQICHYIDFNIANMQIICKLYAKNMLNMQQKYAKNMQLICRICISLCIGIFCIYMHSPSPLCWCLHHTQALVVRVIFKPKPPHWVHRKQGSLPCFRGTFHCPTLLATTLPKTRPSMFGMFRNVSGREDCCSAYYTKLWILRSFQVHEFIKNQFINDFTTEIWVMILWIHKCKFIEHNIIFFSLAYFTTEFNIINSEYWILLYFNEFILWIHIYEFVYVNSRSVHMNSYSYVFIYKFKICTYEFIYMNSYTHEFI